MRIKTSVIISGFAAMDSLEKAKEVGAGFCDKITSIIPASDPPGDIEIGDDYPEPVTYFINTKPHRTTGLAHQVPGVVLVTEQQGGEGAAAGE